jgi:hypothetical protein
MSIINSDEVKKLVFDNVYIPPCHDKKMGKPVDAEFLSESLKVHLEVFKDVSDEFITFLVRTRDDNGEWYFGMATIALDKLGSGSEVHLTKDKKLQMM